MQLILAIDNYEYVFEIKIEAKLKSTLQSWYGIDGSRVHVQQLLYISFVHWNLDN